MSETPQDRAPQLRNSVRMPASAPKELRRERRDAPGVPSLWNSRKTIDISTRAKVGGESLFDHFKITKSHVLLVGLAR